MLIINEIPPPNFRGGVFCTLIIKCTALFSVCCYCKSSEIFTKVKKWAKQIWPPEKVAISIVVVFAYSIPSFDTL